ncbi:MAG: hypothetical protein WCI73_15760, partial [Phycisphaerae bacterium]
MDDLEDRVARRDADPVSEAIRAPGHADGDFAHSLLPPPGLAVQRNVCAVVLLQLVLLAALFIPWRLGVIEINLPLASVPLFMPPPPAPVPEQQRQQEPASAEPEPGEESSQTNASPPDTPPVLVAPTQVDLEKAIDLKEMSIKYDTDTAHELVGLIARRGKGLGCSGASERKMPYVYRVSGSAWTLTTELSPDRWRDYFDLQLDDPRLWPGIGNICADRGPGLVAFALFPLAMEREWHTEIRRLASKTRPQGRIRWVRLRLDNKVPM